MKKVVFIVAGAMILGAMNVHAQEESTGRARVGVHAGYISGGDVEEEGGAAGGQIEVSLTDFLGLEVSATALREEADESESIGTEGELNLLSGGVSAVLRVSSGPVTIYGLGGANFNRGNVEGEVDFGFGVADLDVDVDGVGYHFGGGARLCFGEHVEFFAEYRHTFLELDGEGDATVTSFLGVTTEAEAEVEFDYDFGMAKVGVNLLF